MVHCIHKPKLYDIREFTVKIKIISLLAVSVMLMTALGGCSVDRAADISVDRSRDVITLRLFSNLPDRKNGQGLVEQMIIDDYMTENPNVRIEVEALDEEAYKTRFRAYAMNGMPDIVSIWGQPSFVDEVLEAGILAQLNEDDYRDYGFVNGSLDGFKKEGKLYGLPRNTDVQVIYYNSRMFDIHGWEVPDTYDAILRMRQEKLRPSRMKALIHGI